MSGATKPVLLILAVVLLIFLAGVWLGHTAAKAAQLDDEAEKTSVGSNIDRVIDEEAGVVCWEKGHGDGGLECLPIEQTDLRSGGDQA